jgi:hypothetical protein
MQLGNFTPPLSRLASHFVEEWRFVPQENGTLVTRSVSLYPRRALARPFLLAIAQFLQRALDQHLAEMAASASNQRVHDQLSSNRRPADQHHRATLPDENYLPFSD